MLVEPPWRDDRAVNLNGLRAEYQRRLCAEVLGDRGGTKGLNVADSSNEPSKRLAARMADLIGHPLCTDSLSGQTAGSHFTTITLDFLRAALDLLGPLSPGRWVFAKDPSLAKIDRFSQYAHLGQLAAVAASNREVAVTLGTDYLVTPDIVIGRHPWSVAELEDLGVALGDVTSLRSPNVAAEDELPTLHASISCKWSMRSDRAQNTRTEALNLIRNRKGRCPHVVAVTLEPLPGRIASIAMGTGDMDCTYHAALPELSQAARELGMAKATEHLDLLVDGGRLRDIADLPLDLL